MLLRKRVEKRGREIPDSAALRIQCGQTQVGRAAVAGSDDEHGFRRTVIEIAFAIRLRRTPPLETGLSSFHISHVGDKHVLAVGFLGSNQGMLRSVHDEQLANDILQSACESALNTRTSKNSCDDDFLRAQL